ncbi:hypothetical protein [Mesorhizobium sp. 113-3-9]|uniref:hypothetical protein n=1 Tax=Mesorhizobium sp. 113-3-9 TaxID=2744517 RepID=UPI001926AD7D|nr:hypothetical protein [Mesorhizobium sp. 113-3-9]
MADEVFNLNTSPFLYIGWIPGKWRELDFQRDGRRCFPSGNGKAALYDRLEAQSSRSKDSTFGSLC